MFGWFKRHRKDGLREALMAEAKRADELRQEGWAHWLDASQIRSPYDYEWIDIRWLDDSAISTIKRADMSPVMNVAGLYWRPAKFAERGLMIEGAATL